MRPIDLKWRAYPEDRTTFGSMLIWLLITDSVTLDPHFGSHLTTPACDLPASNLPSALHRNTSSSLGHQSLSSADLGGADEKMASPGGRPLQLNNIIKKTTMQL
ncbi:hypothetical protein TNCV_2037651 [Trichonephila clavipes]|nr:hypothetical protein TNCV_2037651 [Trichonephila clavipes]